MINIAITSNETTVQSFITIAISITVAITITISISITIASASRKVFNSTGPT